MGKFFKKLRKEKKTLAQNLESSVHQFYGIFCLGPERECQQVNPGGEGDTGAFSWKAGTVLCLSSEA